MKNQQDDTKKIVGGLLVGVLGAGALYYWYVKCHQKTPIMKKIGRSISEVGEMIENCSLDSVSHLAETVEKKLPDGAEVLNNLSDWISTARSIWKKLSK